MINSLLVAATAEAFDMLLRDRGIPYEFRDDSEYRHFQKYWDEAKPADRELALRQAKPAVRRIASKEPYIFEIGGEPLCIRFNYLTRELERDSFGEIMLERPDLDWRFSISLKNNARVISALDVADRTSNGLGEDNASMFNEIDDFGSRIFGIPCSNEYFNDVNEILLAFEPYDKATWLELLKDEDFRYGKLVTPMLKAMAAELPRICSYHPEAPRRLFDYFYGSIDYYYFSPIEELQLTRIGAVNSHGGLGRIPGTSNYYTPRVHFPTQLLDVRLATGKYGELSRDTLQATFDGGWSICFRLNMDMDSPESRNFLMNVYLPVTPFGSYRDQVAWDQE